MNINNFEKSIDKKILDRGYDYYNEGNIAEVYSQGDNEYIFKVQGKYDYEVVVNINDNGEILYSDCDCPYDFGPICKHQVAAYFEIYEILDSKHSSKGIKKQISKQSEIKDVLNNLSKEELINIILDVIGNDATFEKSVIFRYSKGNDTQEIQKCKELIDSIVRKYTARQNFINYRETWDFTHEMKDLLEKVRYTDNILLALDISFLVLSEAIEAFQYADDSDGTIGCLASETAQLMREIVAERDDLDINLREEAFNKLFGYIESKVFDGWEEYRIDILRICTEFADIEVLRNKLRMKIEYLIEKNSSDNYMKYSNESMLQILFDIIDKYGTKEEAEQFIKDNLKFTSFRELFINKYIKDKNYYKVIELALEGEKQDEKYAGLISKWKKIRYTAYKELSLKDEQQKLAKDLLLHGNFEYYRELKELYTGDKVTFYNNLKEELKNDDSWNRRNIYLQLIEEENDLDEIMEFVRENPERIDQYVPMLIDRFKDEVIDVYSKFIKIAASQSSDRKAYRGVCAILKRYKKIAGKKNQEHMIRELSVLYKKRPAFIDELSKLK
ncbi:SWIM zinc finger domain-containing protein [Clostridium sp.]|uniref:SWIM zinc finger domain-containing protein n=1 Tax=Clostridium sp. TaxID=1506 RepID=UPI003463F9F7